MEDHQLILITGMSGSGKSTTARSLARQAHLNGVSYHWLHEEIRRHPIRAGEFGLAPLDSAANMERNIQDMMQRWQRMVNRIQRSHSVYIMEGVLYDNIIRYFYAANTPDERVLAYYDRLMEIMAPVRPLVLYLHRQDVRATLESLYPLRGSWWKDLIMDASEMRYFTERGLSGEEGVYAMWQAYQDLSDASFQRCQTAKLRVETGGGDWESYLECITLRLGWQYYPPRKIAVHDPEQYCGTYAVEVDGRRHTIEICRRDDEIYCRGFWPYMQLLPQGGSRFEFASFPITLIFRKNSAGQVTAVRVNGVYDWEIVGQTMKRLPAE